jgi:hypothetical protein
MRDLRFSCELRLLPNVTSWKISRRSGGTNGHLMSLRKKIGKFITGYAMSHPSLLTEASVMKPCKLSATVLRKACLLFTFASCISQLNLILHSHVLTFLTTINYVTLTLKTVPIMLIGFPTWRTNNPPFTRTLGSIMCSSILTKWNKFARTYKHQNTDCNGLQLSWCVVY